MSNSNTAQESLEIMKESEKKVVEESVNKTKYISRSPSKEEVEKDGGEEVSMRQESQVSADEGVVPWGSLPHSASCLLFLFSIEANFKPWTCQEKSQGTTSSDVPFFIVATLH